MLRLFEERLPKLCPPSLFRVSHAAFNSVWDHFNFCLRLEAMLPWLLAVFLLLRGLPPLQPGLDVGASRRLLKLRGPSFCY